jgi:hypothetical protein
MKKKSGAAFSLIEVTLAIGLVAFGVVILIGLVPFGLQSESNATQKLKASQAMNIIAEDILSVAQPYTVKATADTTPAPTPQLEDTTPRFSIPFTAGATGTIYLDDQLNQTTQALNSDTPPRYVAHYECAKGDFWSPYKFKVVVAWPGAAKFEGTDPKLKLTQSQGFVENIITVSRL